MAKDFYIDPGEATRIRVHSEGQGWAIDAAGDDGRFSESCWTHDGSIDQPLTRDRAVELADEFAAEGGFPAGLPIYAQSLTGQHSANKIEWAVVRPARK